MLARGSPLTRLLAPTQPSVLAESTSKRRRRVYRHAELPFHLVQCVPNSPSRRPLPHNPSSRGLTPVSWGCRHAVIRWTSLLSSLSSVGPHSCVVGPLANSTSCDPGPDARASTALQAGLQGAASDAAIEQRIVQELSKELTERAADLPAFELRRCEKVRPLGSGCPCSIALLTGHCASACPSSRSSLHCKTSSSRP